MYSRSWPSSPISRMPVKRPIPWSTWTIRSPGSNSSSQVAERARERAPSAGGLPQAGDRDQARSQPLRQLTALDLDGHQLLEFLLALFGLRHGSSPVEREDERVLRQMVEQGRMRWIEIGLETFDPVEVG